VSEFLEEEHWEPDTVEAVHRRIFEQVGDWICDQGCDVEGCETLEQMMEKLRDFTPPEGTPVDEDQYDCTFV